MMAKFTARKVFYYVTVVGIVMTTLLSVLPYADTDVPEATPTSCNSNNMSEFCSNPSSSLLSDVPFEIKSATRSPVSAIGLQIAIRLKWGVLQWGGLKPLLFGVSCTPSYLRPPNLPKYDLITNVGFMSIWSVAGFARDWYMRPLYLILTKFGGISLMSYLHEILTNRLIDQLEASGYKRTNEIAIPEFDWQSKSPEEFYNTFKVLHHPVVLRGFMNNTELLTKFNFENILKNYAEEKVSLTNNEKDGYEGLLKEVNNASTYLHNSEKIFLKYPEVRKYFQYERFEDYLRMKIGYEQLFVGREGTGSPFHHAAVHNWFYMIDGTKKWWFIDPYDLVLAYPIAYFGRAAGALQILFPYEGNLEPYPLFKYCPLYSTELSKGDVLYNPANWWHAIKNTSPYTTAVASRWHTNGIAGNDYMMTEEDYDIDRLASMSFMLGPTSVYFLHKILQTPTPRFDDHATLREKNNRFASSQRKINSQGGVEYSGITVKF